MKLLLCVEWKISHPLYSWKEHKKLILLIFLWQLFKNEQIYISLSSKQIQAQKW